MDKKLFTVANLQSYTYFKICVTEYVCVCLFGGLQYRPILLRGCCAACILVSFGGSGVT